MAALCLLLAFAGQACKEPTRPARAITLTVADQGWANRDYQRRLAEALDRFTRQTAIRVEVLPTPETAGQRLATWRKLLESRAKLPDVYGIDVIWPRILADNLLDLRDYIPQQEIASHFPELIANDTVNGRLVALPAYTSEGLLFYRSDLLRKYGFRAPPRSWQELEAMARRIQAGERAKGIKDFWGFVWEGDPSETLTCNAMEWQMSEGGGTIIDENGKITVNNPRTIRAWQRAAHWVGSISPPGVVVYKEWDAQNVWLAGKAAFIRNWSSEYIATRDRDSPVRDTFDIAPLPGGTAGIAATLGGSGFGVSRYSLHPREAAMLVRFLCSRDEQIKRCRKTSDAPTMPELYHEPEVLANNPQFPLVLEIFRKGVFLRPSGSAGKMYAQVSNAYSEAVHSVLTGKKSAAQAAGELQGELQRTLGTPVVISNSDLQQRR